MQYTVRKGDTLQKVANRFGISVEAVRCCNPGVVGVRLIPGQILSIVGSLRRYEIQPGDTLDFIAQAFNLAPERIAAINHFSDGMALEPGKVIALPPSQPDGIVRTDEEYTHRNLAHDLAALLDLYPFLGMEVIGYSVLGKPLYAIRLGIGEKEVFYSGAWHANEWLTAAVLMKFVENAACAYARDEWLDGYNVRQLLDTFTIWIVPLVNPDGVELSVEGMDPCHPFYKEVRDINGGTCNFTGWTANVRGVDLNHQWPAGWEEEAKTSPDRPSPRHYGGPTPLSEPEAQAVYAFTKAHDFLGVLAYHSQGQVIYWGYQQMEPPESRAIVQRLQVLSTYQPVRTANSYAGYKDWFIQEYRRPGYTIEIGIGVNPVPLEQFDAIYRQNRAVLLETPLLLDKRWDEPSKQQD